MRLSFLNKSKVANGEDDRSKRKLPPVSPLKVFEDVPLTGLTGDKVMRIINQSSLPAGITPAVMGSYTASLMSSLSRFFIPAHCVKDFLLVYQETLLPVVTCAWRVFRLSGSTLLLAVFLAFKHFSRRSIQTFNRLHPLAFLLIAVKFEEVAPPQLDDLFEMLGTPSENLRREVISCEAEILSEMGFALGVPPLFDLVELSRLCEGRPPAHRVADHVFVTEHLPRPQALFCRQAGLLLAAEDLIGKLRYAERHT